MRRTILGLTIASAAVCIFGALPAIGSGNVDLLVGQKELDTNFGNGTDMEEQDAAGLLMDWGRSTWPVHIALDLLAGNQDVNDDDFDVDLDGSTGEILVGARWYPTKLNESRWMPHLGGGLGYISGEVETSAPGPNDFRFDDSKLGYWADAGLQYRFGQHFKLGGRARYSEAELDTDFEDVDAGGFTWGIDGGWTW